MHKHGHRRVVQLTVMAVFVDADYSCNGGRGVYSPSPMEGRWLSTHNHKQICSMATDSFELQCAKHWLKFSTPSAEGPFVRTPTAEQAEVLSNFTSCQKDGHGAIEYIEPLTGMARHPLADVGCDNPRARDAREMQRSLRAQFGGHRRPSEMAPRATPVSPSMNSSETPLARAHIADTSYIVLANQCGSRHLRASSSMRNTEERERADAGRNFFFDLGCAGPPPKEQDGMAHQPYHQHPSIPQFAEMYSKRCIEFDRIFGWELDPQNHAEWWESVPRKLRNKVTFFNLGVAKEEAKHADQNKRAHRIESERNEPKFRFDFLSFLKDNVHANDFVAVKIDIDHTETELSIVHAIANSASLSSLIDELFFEYHFTFDAYTVIAHAWNVHDPRHTVDHALRLLHKLRLRGIRAHFWI